MKEFKDKVIVVTGGARGIGKAIAVEGAKRGMNVVLNDIDQRHGFRSPLGCLAPL